MSPLVVVVDAATLTDSVFRPTLTEKHLFAGDTPTLKFLVKDTGEAKTLDGLSVGFTAKVSAGASTAFIINRTATNTVGETGAATITLTSAETATAGTYVAEVTLWGTGSRLTALQFPLVIDSSVAL